MICGFLNFLHEFVSELALNFQRIACKVTDDMKSVGKCVDMKKFNPKNSQLSDKKWSKSLLNVPAIFVDNLEKEIATISIASSVFDLDETGMDPETVSMIVRNVEAMDKEDLNMVEIDLPKEEKLEDLKVVNPKKPHDFMHSIQEKLHDVLHHKKESEHAKTKEIFHDIKENVSGKFHQIAEKMHNFHLPHHHPDVPHDGLVATAMQAILLDKFNIAEASTAVHVKQETMQKRKSSSSSLQSIKEKFQMIQRPRRSLEMPSDTTSLNSISEASPSKTCILDDYSSVLELKIHDSDSSTHTSVETIKTANSTNSVESFNPVSLTHKNFDKVTTFADTNKAPLHESLLSFTRKELSSSPAAKTHARGDSNVGMKFAASPARNVSSSLGKDQMTTGIHRRSSDSDLSITPKGGEFLKTDVNQLFLSKKNPNRFKKFFRFYTLKNQRNFSTFFFNSI